MRLVGIAFIIGIGGPNVAEFLAVYQSKEYPYSDTYPASIDFKRCRPTLSCLFLPLREVKIGPLTVFSSSFRSSDVVGL